MSEVSDLYCVDFIMLLLASLVREDLLNRTNPKCPVILDYRQTADLDSVYNTPCTVAVYVLGLVLDWIIAHGGVKGVIWCGLTIHVNNSVVNL